MLRLSQGEKYGTYQTRPYFYSKGKITYNSGIVSGIVALAISEVEGVSLLTNKIKVLNSTLKSKAYLRI